MADKKVTALTDIGTGLASSDIWMVIDDPGGTPTNKKMTVSNFLPYLPYYIGFSQTPQALTAAGAVDITSAITTVASSAAIALTLANGTSANQIKIITMITDGGTVTLTPATMNDGTNLVFADVGDSAILMWIGASGWQVISMAGTGATGRGPLIS